jgi:hypothetical protein
MKKAGFFFLLFSLALVTVVSAVSFKIGSQLSLKHDANDRYIDGFGLSLATKLDMHMDLFFQAGFQNWRTGVERTSPSNAHEFYYDQSTYLLGFRYWINAKSGVTPYIHIMLGMNYDDIEYRVTTFSAPGYYFSSQHSSIINENSRNAGLGFGFSFPVINNIYYDMSITMHSAPQLYSNVVMLVGLYYKLGF